MYELVFELFLTEALFITITIILAHVIMYKHGQVIKASELETRDRNLRDRRTPTAFFKNKFIKYSVHTATDNRNQ